MELTFEDEFAIQSLAAKMYWGLDSKDSDQFSGVFADDGKWLYPFGEAHGRDKIKAWVDDQIANGMVGDGRHVMTNQYVESHPDGAVMKCYVTKVIDNTTPPTVATGHVRIIAAKEAGSWRFKEMKIVIDNMPTRS